MEVPFYRTPLRLIPSFFHSLGNSDKISRECNVTFPVARQFRGRIPAAFCFVGLLKDDLLEVNGTCFLKSELF